ncbi:hypothetical protein J437_LFUL008582 [Ladona fulva]|uniref:Integrase catalytic domain-containing protein n=1 Tax=Ladona fulva TaxID=123851 RepID=A0A8K0K9G5_LADFU|nr:hypothetical protein J437_LFUL008582 [Ladona fulva]
MPINKLEKILPLIGIKKPARRVAAHYVWPLLKKNYQQWAKECIPCQCSKITWHVSFLIGNFPQSQNRFKHVHLDIVGPLPLSQGFCYCLTCLDRYARWMTQFDTPLHVTMDRGKQFKSQCLSQIAGLSHLQTTACHPVANSMVGCHSQIKSALWCHTSQDWTEILLVLLLGLTAALR